MCYILLWFLSFVLLDRTDTFRPLMFQRRLSSIFIPKDFSKDSSSTNLGNSKEPVTTNAGINTVNLEPQPGTKPKTPSPTTSSSSLWEESASRTPAFTPPSPTSEKDTQDKDQLIEVLRVQIGCLKTSLEREKMKVGNLEKALSIHSESVDK